MLKHLRTAAVAGVFATVLALSAQADDKAPPAGAPPAAAPAAAPAADGCAPPVQTVCVTEWVPEQYQSTRTCYRTEYRQETYNAYRTESVPETRTRTVTVCRMVPETRTEVRNVCVSVPVVETRTVMQTCVSYKPVVHMVCKTEDHGHYECQEVPCGPSMKDRLHKLCHRHDCCCEEECVRTKTKKVWVPCLVTTQVPVTKCERVCEQRPVTVQVRTCRQEVHQESYQVCCYKSVPETRTETCQVMTCRQVPYQATRCVAVCVPHQETVTLTRMVAHQVQKEVPVVQCGCESSCCATPCCHKKHHHGR